jgi:hypothetical protein
VSTLPPRKLIGHFVMNLPDSALTFLDAFRGILSGPCLREAYQDKLPMVHCHCFTRELEPEKAQADILAVSCQPRKRVLHFTDCMIESCRKARALCGRILPSSCAKCGTQQGYVLR